MSDFRRELNDLLIDTYKGINTVETRMLHNSKLDLSIGELHMIEIVARESPEGITVGEIARELGLSMPTVTIATNKLVRKGDVEKYKKPGDARKVFVRVTNQGHRADISHRFFHEQMVRNVAKEITEDEQEIFLKGIKTINSFVRRQAEQLREEAPAEELA